MQALTVAVLGSEDVIVVSVLVGVCCVCVAECVCVGGLVGGLGMQALAVAVLGSEDMAQKVDSLTDPEENKRFYLHVSFGTE